MCGKSPPSSTIKVRYLFLNFCMRNLFLLAGRIIRFARAVDSASINNKEESRLLVSLLVESYFTAMLFQVLQRSLDPVRRIVILSASWLLFGEKMSIVMELPACQLDWCARAIGETVQIATLIGKRLNGWQKSRNIYHGANGVSRLVGETLATEPPPIAFTASEYQSAGERTLST